MSENSRSGAKNTLRWVAFAAAGAAVLLLLGGIYITRSFTWRDVYSAFGLETAQGAEEASDNKPSFELIEGELEGETARVSFLAVGQGDCTVIRAGGMTAIIDAGDYDAAAKLASYLKANEITKVDYLFATHPHADHIGSMSVILNSCEVGRCVMTRYSDELTPTNYTYISLLKQLGALGVPTFLAEEGETFELGGGAVTALLSGNFGNLNDCSLVLRFDFGERSFLFMGDAGFAPEEKLLSGGANIKSDVIKIGHHGSRYSTSGAFFAAVSPRYAVVSCGANNQYGYPSADVVNVIDKNGATMLLTDSGEDVVFETDGRLLNVRQKG